MLNNLGFTLQFLALVFLPMLIIWQLNFGFQLLWMPTLTIAGAVVFWIGHMLRERGNSPDA
ncbi:hypothetical protein Mal4_30350 [Maioricimonas rarisocia]|uniref:Uncharacterized protein n=1 Tax=Maioricimonas rarisocia TaxID=2528026 RepID=A0A517Z8B1_9PLAN|nr:hypothetical protein [Maioricimonas rarisocia]QDU38705.1 hypothetical protein Mal4_30350 [Maioricimonas rarisocia]